MGTIRSEFRSSIWLIARLPAILYLKTSLWPQSPPLRASPPLSLVPLPPWTPQATTLPFFYLHASSWPGDPLGPCRGRGGPRGSRGPVWPPACSKETRKEQSSPAIAGTDKEDTDRGKSNPRDPTAFLFSWAAGRLATKWDGAKSKWHWWQCLWYELASLLKK